MIDDVQERDSGLVDGCTSTREARLDAVASTQGASHRSGRSGGSGRGQSAFQRTRLDESSPEIHCGCRSPHLDWPLCLHFASPPSSRRRRARSPPRSLLVPSRHLRLPITPPSHAAPTPFQPRRAPPGPLVRALDQAQAATRRGRGKSSDRARTSQSREMSEETRSTGWETSPPSTRTRRRSSWPSTQVCSALLNHVADRGADHPSFLQNGCLCFLCLSSRRSCLPSNRPLAMLLSFCRTSSSSRTHRRRSLSSATA